MPGPRSRLPSYDEATSSDSAPQSSQRHVAQPCLSEQSLTHSSGTQSRLASATERQNTAGLVEILRLESAHQQSLVQQKYTDQARTLDPSDAYANEQLQELQQEAAEELGRLADRLKKACEEVRQAADLPTGAARRRLGERLREGLRIDGVGSVDVEPSRSVREGQ